MKILSDNDIQIIETIQFINIVSINLPLLKDAISTIPNNPREQWHFVQRFDKPIQPDHVLEVAEEPGFILFKDWNIFFLFTDNLSGTLVFSLQDDVEEAFQCLHKLVSVKGRMRNEIFHQIELQVPAFIIPHNLLMNAVNRFHQVWSTHMTKSRQSALLCPFLQSCWMLLFIILLHCQ